MLGFLKKRFGFGNMESNDPKSYSAEWHGDYEDGKPRPDRSWKGVEDEKLPQSLGYEIADIAAEHYGLLAIDVVCAIDTLAEKLNKLLDAHNARIRRETARECAELAVNAIYEHHSVRSRDDLRAAIIDPIDHPEGWNDHDAIAKGGEG